MTPIDTLPDTIRAQIAGHDVIVFDGVCVLCGGFFRFMERRDRNRRFRFVLAQSELGAALYKALDLNPSEFETNLVIVDGRIHTHLDAFAQAMGVLGGGWRLLRLLSYLPKALKHPVYNLIARNRYRLFGKTETCLVPDARMKDRFLSSVPVVAAT